MTPTFWYGFFCQHRLSHDIPHLDRLNFLDLPLNVFEHLHIHLLPTMDFGGGAFGGGDPKTQIMRQVQQETAVQNARQLVEVHFPFSYKELKWGCTC